MRKVKIPLFKNGANNVGNSFLLISVIVTIFFVSLLPPAWHDISYNILFTAIFISAVYAMNKYRRNIIIGAIIAVTLKWISSIFGFPILLALSQLANIIFFLLIVVRLVTQLTMARRVTANVIAESINAYLLIGLAFSIIVAFIMEYKPEAFNFPMNNDLSTTSISNYIYFTFVTLSTLGYGDVTPQIPFSRSLSIMISVTGQLYMTIIIALLIGKYLSQNQEQNEVVYRNEEQSNKK